MTLAVGTPKDEYLALVREFAPRPIHNTEEYKSTVDVMNKLAVRDEDSLSDAERDYLDALTLFVKQYDDANFKFPKSGTPLSRLKSLIHGAGMTASDLGRLLNSRGLGSLLLTGKRELSKTHIVILSKHFKLSADYFL